MSFHLAQHESSQPSLRPVLREYWRSSLTQATIAELIAEQLEGVDPPTYFLAAMLQDIGILAMLSEESELYIEQVLERARFPRVVTAERNVFGISHIDVSCAMLDKWGMQESFRAAIRHHHDQIVLVDGAGANRLGIALAAANLGAEMLLAYRVNPTTSTVPEWAGFLATRLNLNETQASDIINQVSCRVREYSALFAFDIGDRVCPERIIAEAKELLQDIALRDQLEMAREIQRRRDEIDEDQLYRDGLSGLFNRHFLNDRLSACFVACMQNLQSVGLVFIDIDKFKHINDAYGHLAGDRAIKHVADWLRQSLRGSDLAIRLGGDEFLVMLHNISCHDLQCIVDRVITNAPPFLLGDQSTCAIGLSIGCVHYEPRRNQNPDLNCLIDLADQAMYQSKRLGGNCWTRIDYDPAIDAQHT